MGCVHNIGSVLLNEGVEEESYLGVLRVVILMIVFADGVLIVAMLLRLMSALLGRVGGLLIIRTWRFTWKEATAYKFSYTIS